jgi:hypothetical protein
MKPLDFDSLFDHFERIKRTAPAPVAHDAKKRLRVLKRKKQLAEKDARFYARNREARLAASKEYREKNPEKNREACRRYREKLKRIAASRAHSESSPQS